MEDTQHKRYIKNFEHGECVEEITFILTNQLIANSVEGSEGVVKLKEKISSFVSKNTKIQLLLPAFPCKTNNLDKVLGHRPDLGEYLALKKFVKIIREIQELYAPGVMFYIFSDYHTFSDYISVNLEYHYDYSNGLRRMVESLKCTDSLVILNFEHFSSFDKFSDSEYFQVLKNQFGDLNYEENFSELKLKNNKMNETYLGLKKFMGRDQKYVLAKYSHRERRKRLAIIAKGMMVQGKALDNFLRQNFSECIRLSIHDHKMHGEKYSIHIFEQGEFKTPWHSTLMFDAESGKFLVDSSEKHLRSDGAIIPVIFDQTPWCYIRLTASSKELEKQLIQFTATLLTEKSDLMLENMGYEMPRFLISHKELDNLNKEFGNVLFSASPIGTF